MAPRLILLPIILAFLICGCNTPPPSMHLDGVTLRYGLLASIDGKEYIGSAVLPLKDTYDFHITSRGAVDSLSISTCHRYWRIIDGQNVTVKVKRKFLVWKTKTIIVKNQVKFTYTPTKIEEGCPLLVSSTERIGSRNDSFFVAFHDKEYTAKATVDCNGESLESTGVAVCQGKAGHIQAIRFEEDYKPLTVFCGMKEGMAKRHLFQQRKGKCVTVFTNGVHYFKLYTMGFTEWGL